MDYVPEQQMREAVMKLSAAFGPPPPHFFEGKPDWVKKKVRKIIRAKIKAQGSNDGILTINHIMETIKKVEKTS